ncbi:MAG: DEAD/DEAH box helicase family protein [Thermoguttaceae bacterium]
MALKPFTLSVPPSKKPTDPLEIFNKLTLRGSIENIWEPQAEALRAWHRVRNASDVVVQMNTGGGKTLVGLITAQSLLNELNRRILYVVPNNQLVEQTLAKAAELGLQPATRYKGQWRNQEAFQSAETFCITNYAAVFTGYSTFCDKDIGGLIFDDAHVAEGTIRDQFTLRIAPKTDLFNAIITLYRPHFVNALGASKLEDISKGNPTVLLFVPMFIVWKHAQELRKILIDGGVDADGASTRFVWDHLGDHLAHCCVLISGNGIEIGPPVIPLHTLPYFSPNVRRVYLTATLPSEASFARTFGLHKPEIVRPGGKSGDAQRLFIFTSGTTDQEQRKSALELVAGRKACVISPSATKAEQWTPPAIVFDKDSGHEGIEKFSASKEPQLMGLVARYDGIDLPGDACHVLILDRLPKGEALFDRFIDEGVRIGAIRIGNAATRIVQAIGRIFRSNTDHGVVILTGTDLQDWIRNPTNRAYLPNLLQQQVALGIELSKKVAAKDVTWGDLLDGVLAGDVVWDGIYNEYVNQFATTTRPSVDDWYPPTLLAERRGYAAIWDGKHSEAITVFSNLANDAESKDRRLAAWYKHLEGVAHLCASDQATALQAFTAASLQRFELGRPSEHRDKMFKPPKADGIGFQATKLASLYRDKRVNVLSAIDRVRSDLAYGPNTAAAEEAMRMLGVLLGLESTRPDAGKGTGPDNLWCGKGEVEAWGFDLKTGKETTSEYDKDDIGRAYIHAQWVRDNLPGRTNYHSIVGHELRVSNLTNPSPSLDIIDLNGFRELADNVKRLLDSIDVGDKSNLEDAFEGWLRHYGLVWPTCVLALPSKSAVDLRAE